MTPPASGLVNPIKNANKNEGETTHEAVYEDYDEEWTFEGEVKEFKIEFDDDHLSYVEHLQMIEENKFIEELMFGGGSLLGIQDQVDDLVITEVVT